MPHRAASAEPDSIKVDGRDVVVTHTDRVLFPSDNITKGELIDYYRAIAPVMLPHLRDRPVHVQRFPRGIESNGFVQKEAPDGAPDWIRRVTVEKEGGTITQVVCDNAATLTYLANQDSITIHNWLSRTDRLDYPDRMAIDLDPSAADFEVVRRTARLARELLHEIGLPHFLMTTGSRGLHVVVPLDRSTNFDNVRAFAREIAEELVRRDPEWLTLEMGKQKRGKLLFLDTLRNSYAATAVAPYSVRAKPHAPVATPIEWDELEEPEMRSDRWTVRTIPERIRQTGEPWRDIARHATGLREATRHLREISKGAPLG